MSNPDPTSKVLRDTPTRGEVLEAPAKPVMTAKPPVKPTESAEMKEINARVEKIRRPGSKS